MAPKTRKTLTLSFRVDADIGSTLLSEAKLENVSIHEIGRQRVLRSLVEQPMRDELLEIKELIQTLYALIQDLLMTVEEDDDETFTMDDTSR